MPRVATGLNTASRKLPDGTTEYRWYHRATGNLIGKSSDGWTKEAAIERAKEFDAPSAGGAAAGSFGELCTMYLASPGFKKKAAATQRGYRDHIDTLREMWGSVPVQGITRKAVTALHATYEDRPWQGNAVMRTLRMLFNFGLFKLEMPGLAKNPAERTDLYETAPRTQIWDQPRIDAFLDAAHPRLRLAFALLLFTVQRASDVLKMERPQMFEKEGRTWIRLRQAKTDELVDVPCHRRLLEELASHDRLRAAEQADPRRAKLAQSPRLVASPRGLPWTYRNFARAWDQTKRRANWAMARAAIRARRLPPPAKAKEREKAKAAIRARLLHDLQRRDLRRTGVVQQALAGSTVPQIAALAGWRIDYASKIVDTYLPRRSEVALGGVVKWEADEGRVVPLARQEANPARG